MDKFHRAYLNIYYYKNKDGTDKDEATVWKVKDGSLSIKDFEDRGCYLDVAKNDGSWLSLLLKPDGISIFITPSSKDKSQCLGTIYTDGTLVVTGDAYSSKDGTTVIEPKDEDEDEDLAGDNL